MRCLCQVVTAAVILFLSFVPLFQVKFSENTFTLSALPRHIVQYNTVIYRYDDLETLTSTRVWTVAMMSETRKHVTLTGRFTSHPRGFFSSY